MVFGGGIIPEADMPALTAMGVAKIFTPGATTGEIVELGQRDNLGAPQAASSRERALITGPLVPAIMQLWVTR